MFSFRAVVCLKGCATGFALLLFGIAIAPLPSTAQTASNSSATKVAAAPDQNDPAPWPTTQGTAETVVLSYYASLFDRLLDLIVGSDRLTVRLHEYADVVETIDRTHARVRTTGNSLTFAVPEVVVSQSVMTGSGDRFLLPERLYFDGNRAVYQDATANPPKSRLTALIESVSRTKASKLQKFEAVGYPPPAALGKLLASFATAGAREPVSYAYQGEQISYAGAQHCGFHLFKWNFDAERKTVLDQLQPPLSQGNVLAKFDGEGRVLSVVVCNLHVEGSICRSLKPFNSWATFEVVFSHEQLCQRDHLMDATDAWFRRHVIAETTAPTNADPGTEE